MITTEIGGGESSSNIINQENEEISLPDLNSNLDDEIIVIQHQNYHFNEEIIIMLENSIKQKNFV